MSAEAVKYILAQNIKPIALKFYMERLAYRIENDKGYGWPSQDLIAKELSTSRKTVQKLQAEAERRGYIRALAHKTERGKFSSNHYEIPGFVDWLKQAETDAVSFFVRAIGPESPCELRGGTDKDTVGTTGWHGPCELRGGTDRGNYGVAQKERLKEKVKRERARAKPRTLSASLSVPDRDEGKGYDEFVSAYSAMLARCRPSSSSQAETVEAGRSEWRKLSPDDKAARYNALLGYEANLRAQSYKQPQGLKRFLTDGWKDFLPKEQTEDDKLDDMVTAAEFAVLGRDPESLRECGWRRFADIPAEVLGKLSADIKRGLAEMFPSPMAQAA